MDLSQLKTLFNRAWAHAFSPTKVLVAFAVGLACGLLILSLRGVALGAGSWALTSLTFLGVFLSSALLVPGGMLLCQTYHKELKADPVELKDLVVQSWPNHVQGAYFFLPLILTYLVLWVVLGLFFLIREIPFIGSLFATLLAFGPFLLMVGALTLCLAAFVLLFFVTPALAIGQDPPLKILRDAIKRLQKDPFSHLVTAFLAVLPFSVVAFLLNRAASWTEHAFINEGSLVQMVLSGFVVMVPFTALLAPFLVFFFNFATEAHLNEQHPAKQTGEEP